MISVIVPIYRVEEYLDRCVQSLVDQTCRDIEIILVDDGSPDNCPGLCDAWACRDERIRVVHKENGGLSDARNAGLRVAKGERIAFVDSDDYVDPLFLETLQRTMEQTKADIVACGVVLVDEAGTELRRRICRDPKMTFSKTEALTALIQEQDLAQTVWNKLYTRAVLKGIDFEVGKYHEDDFWSYRVFDRAETVAAVSDGLYFYLQRSGSIMGVGYSLKRLDGLEARFRRMEDLWKYEALRPVLGTGVWYDCLFHFQSAAGCLTGEDQQKVADYVLPRLEKLPRPGDCGIKYRLWFWLFRHFPYFTAKLRNRLGIGG